MAGWARRFSLFLAIGFALAGAGFGQAEAACALAKFAELPITMRGSSPTTPAKVNGSDVLFVTDSGAFFSIISPAAAKQFNLPERPTPFGFYLSGIGGSADASIATVKAFGLSGAVLSDQLFLAGGSDVVAPAVGVIGQNILGLGDVDYDFAHGAVRLMRPKGCQRQDLAYWGGGQAYSVLPIEPTQPGRTLTRATVLVNGVRVKALFDTGASSSQISPAAARRAGVRTDGPEARPAGVVRGFGGRTLPLWTASFAKVQVGDEQIRNTRLYIGSVGEGDEEMLVGADFFLSHRVYVANSQAKMFFSYIGGPVFDLSHPPRSSPPIVPGAAATAPAVVDASGSEPKDADGYSRRGAASAARRDYPSAIADFSRAMELSPAEPRYAFQRAGARLSADQPFLAMEDVDTVLRLDPQDADARLMRAGLRLAGHDPSGAGADLDAAAAAAPKEADLRLQLGQRYLALDQFGPAITQFDLWTAVHEADSRLPEALNGRCWARALAGQQLDRALSDCNRAVRLSGRQSTPLDSRGLVYLRLGQFDRSIADYDAVLALKPRSAWSLYGRGLAELKTGKKDQGDADIAAAAALAPHLAERAAKLGLAPSS